ncbi:MAG TPA: WG repeat-containing protein, partial [Cyclobacteriaceae bacterium]
MKSRYTLTALLISLLLVAACSIWKKDDPDKEIRAFIAEFEKSLAGSDEVVLKQFEAHQSKEAILSAIHVLQNKELDHLHCNTNFAAASIAHEANGIKIEIPVTLTAENLTDTLTRESSIIFWVEPDHGHFVISKLEGESFYNAYLSIKYEVNMALNKELEMANRKIYFETAHALQQKYDSIIWYVHYNAKTYYYAVSGPWENYFIDRNEKPAGYKMGLVDETGAVIIPLDYDLVGTPGMIESDIVEVKKDGLVGFFSIDGKQLIAPEYDWIIPYDENDTYALVKRDTTYGWLTK